MDEKSFTTSSSDTETMFSDQETKDFVEAQGLKDPKFSDLEALAESMKKYKEFDMARKVKKSEGSDDSLEKLYKATIGQMETGSQITFQSEIKNEKDDLTVKGVESKSNLSNTASQISMFKNDTSQSHDLSAQSSEYDFDVQNQPSKSNKSPKSDLYTEVNPYYERNRYGPLETLDTSPSPRTPLNSVPLPKTPKKPINESPLDILPNQLPPTPIQQLRKQPTPRLEYRNISTSQENSEFEFEKIKPQPRSEIRSDIETSTPISSVRQNKPDSFGISPLDQIHKQLDLPPIDEQQIKLNDLLGKHVKCGINWFFDVEIKPHKIFYLVNDIKEDLKKHFKNHKIIVNIVVSDSLSDPFKMGVECLLDEEKDIFAHYAYQSDKLHLIASAYAILF
ncbi:unnamed protein product [Brachionus calyciflorus]|uniref:Uncharacterized protein n=1 Tax=Brachionus calyciflorus TaxID=104777 RepID=A0A814B3E3_9BILA|nr:unnamed protein product [Brachionus calyciflorus]